MNITFYKNVSEPERVTKSLLYPLPLTGSLRDSSNVINPEIIIEGNPGNFPTLYNYAYIPEFGRYYYVGDPVAYRNNLISVPLSVDVLMSFKDAILANEAVIDKQDSNGNIYLNDGIWTHEAREFYTIKSFANGFNDAGEYILITAGA